MAQEQHIPWFSTARSNISTFLRIHTILLVPSSPHSNSAKDGKGSLHPNQRFRTK
jgi:hypothetical protein